MTTWHDTTLAPRARAEALLAELTLAEKAAQLGSFWNRPRAEAASDDGEHHDVAPMEHAMASTGWEEAHREGLGQLTRIFGTATTGGAASRRPVARTPISSGRSAPRTCRGSSPRASTRR